MIRKLELFFAYGFVLAMIVWLIVATARSPAQTMAGSLPAHVFALGMLGWLVAVAQRNRGR